jgi:phospholipase C
MANTHPGRIARVVLLSAMATVSTGIALPSLANDPATTTPIKHVIVIFQENVSFDHYFATYPVASNRTPGDPRFFAAEDTPAINGLLTGFAAPPNNPTLNVAGTGTLQPFRLGRNQATTCDEDHNYTDEQAAYHAGQMDLVAQKLSSTSANCAPDKSTVMGYFDGNTVTALWNYAQHFAMSDNSFGTTYGPSTPGALNLVSGNTHGVTGTTVTGFGPVPGINQSTGASGSATVTIAGSDSNGNTGGGSILGDPRPFGDICNPLGSAQVRLDSPGRNVGDLLTAAGISWGWFQGGFGHCNSVHMASDGSVKQDYIGHHEPFQYFASTQNLAHLAASSPSMVGFTDQAKHQYDLDALFAVNSVSGASSRTYDITGFKPDVKLPAVTFLKAPGFMDGHAGYSDPLLEQHFLVQVINTVMTSKYWNDTAIIIAYDDSDGWYDHVYPPLANASNLSALPASSDALTGTGQCGVPLPGAELGRCGYGPRLPLIVISPFARRNFVDHSVTDQSSILRFVEDNFGLGRVDAPSGRSVANGGSFDQIAGSITTMLDLDDRHDGFHDESNRLLLDSSTGQPLHR